MNAPHCICAFFKKGKQMSLFENFLTVLHTQKYLIWPDGFILVIGFGIVGYLFVSYIASNDDNKDPESG